MASNRTVFIVNPKAGNGFMGENGPIQPEAVLGFIPDGTGCDFVRTVPIFSALASSMTR